MTFSQLPEIRLLTLHQPFATLMAGLWKSIETRSWSTSYRGLVAIHAGKSLEWLHLVDTDPVFRNAIMMCKDRVPWRAEYMRDLLPLGKIVAVGFLESCRRTEYAIVDAQARREVPFGNYEPNRFGWLFSPLHALSSPIPFRGGQGLRPITDLHVARQLWREYQQHATASSSNRTVT